MDTPVEQLPDWHQRLIVERDELHARLDKLRAFWDNPKFLELHSVDRSLLHEQYRYMGQYLGALNWRIARAKTAMQEQAGN